MCGKINKGVKMEKDVKVLPVVEAEIRVMQREVKQGAEKGKKFMAYQIFNKKKGHYEELRFNKKVTNMPKDEGSFIVVVPRTEINRIGTSSRKYPLTWISEISSVSAYDNGVGDLDFDEDDLPF